MFWDKKIIKTTDKGHMPHLKDRDPIVSYDLAHKYVIVRFHNLEGGCNLPFEFIKKIAIAISKMEEHICMEKTQ